MREIETKRKKTETTFPKRICLLLSRLSYCDNAKCEHFLNRVGRHRAITTYEKKKTKQKTYAYVQGFVFVGFFMHWSRVRM